jgi:SOS-response transcriptional repressor LexA
MGAAILIQKTFRSWIQLNKEKWRRKHEKFILKSIAQKKLFQAVIKSKTTPFIQDDLKDATKLCNASTTVMNRVVRGFLGRKRFQHFKEEKENDLKRKLEATIRLQSFGRRIIVWQRYPQLGHRYRLYAKKKTQFYKPTEKKFTREEVLKYHQDQLFLLAQGPTKENIPVTSKLPTIPEQTGEELSSLKNNLMRSLSVSRDPQHKPPHDGMTTALVPTTGKINLSSSKSSQNLLSPSTSPSVSTNMKKTLSSNKIMSDKKNVVSSAKDISVIASLKSSKSVKDLASMKKEKSVKNPLQSQKSVKGAGLPLASSKSMKNISSSFRHSVSERPPTDNDDNDENLTPVDVPTSIKPAVPVPSAQEITRYLYYPTDFNPDERRKTFTFRNLKLSSDMDFLEKKTIQIQCLFRIVLAKKKVSKRKEEKKLNAISKIQKWYRRSVYLHKFYSILLYLYSIHQELQKNYQVKKVAVVIIQKNIRRFVQRRQYLRYLNRKTNSTQMISTWFYQRFCVKKVHKTLEYSRNYKELSLAGVLLYHKTEMRWLCHYMYEGLRKQKQIDKQNHELQKIFASHSLSTGMDVAKAIKLLKECKGLIKEGEFSLNTVELQYVKVKHPNEKRIDYPTFLDLLTNLMILKEFRLDPPKGLWDMDDNESIYLMKSVNNAADSDGRPPSMTVKELKSFPFVGYKGKQAFLLKFILTYLSTTPDYLKIVEFLGSKSAAGQCSMLLTSNIRLLQQFFKNRYCIHQLNKSLDQYQIEKRFRNQVRAAVKMQHLIKSFLAFRFITKIAQNVYNKFIDGESEREYWYNPRTAQSFWSKPKMLGRYDCGMALRMPTELEKFVVNCQICEKNYSTCYCKDCSLVYCTPCYATAHRSGNRSSHSYLQINNCIQCDFQIGTKYCLTCKDLYCDSCYFYMHKKGRLRFHSYEKYCQLCDFCHSFSCQAVENCYTVDNIFLTHYYCNKCYLKEYQIMPEERILQLRETKTGAYYNQKRKWKACKLEKHLYYGKAFTEYNEKLSEEQRKLEIQQAYEKRLKELQLLKEINSVVTIQRIFRGFQKRRQIEAFIEERKLFLLQRVEEDKLRSSLLTKFLTFIGFTQTFATDTPLEKVHKLYPWYMHHIVAECIENKWNEACAMIIEHDEYMKHAPKSSFWEYYSLKFKIYFAKGNYEKAQQVYDAKVVMVNNASENYYNVRNFFLIVRKC